MTAFLGPCKAVGHGDSGANPISKLQSAYRLQFGSDGQSLQWLNMDDDKEVVLTTEPDTTFLFRLQNWLFGPFVPEQQL